MSSRGRFPRRLAASILLVVGIGCAPAAETASRPKVELRPVEAESRVDALISGNLFTSYRYGPEFWDKPVFYPVLTAGGAMLNRGYPMREDIVGENRDHPHQQSLFFAYGDVNGVDFWGPREGRRIAHREILHLESGDSGLLKVRLEWLDPQGVVLLEETRTVTLGTAPQARWMDHDIRLRSVAAPVRFGDTKEGMFAMRVASTLREEDATGRYFSSFGGRSEAEIWGKRAEWVALAGRVGQEEVTLAIFDHPATEGHPSRWHARAYGLFAANPFGVKDFEPDAEFAERILEPGQSYRFRYRLIVYAGRAPAERISGDYAEFKKSR